jgi:hypothetical protein
MHIVFSSENTRYMWWQAELLYYTYLKTGMRHRMTALVSETDEAAHSFTCPTFRAANYKNRVGKPDYVPLNKPGAIAEWIAAGSCRDESVLIVDPDSAFVHPMVIPTELRDGVAYADSYLYMLPILPANQIVLQRHCKTASRRRVQPVGIYILLRKTNLAEIAPLWLQKAIDIRSDRVCAETLPYDGWLSEMLAYAIATAELGIHHRIVKFSQSTGSNSIDAPIVHYYFPLYETHAGWAPKANERILWSKWTYEPWTEAPAACASTVEGKALLTSLNELAVLKRMHGDSAMCGRSWSMEDRRE